MTQMHETRPLGAAGFGNSSLFCRCDNPENGPSNHHIQATNKLRLRYLAARLHDRGPKPLFHFLDEVERGEPLRPHLEVYARWPVAFIKANRGDQFVPAVHIVDGDGR